MVLDLELAAPLERADMERLEAEAWHASTMSIAGTLPVTRVELERSRVRVSLSPIPEDAIRLDTLFTMLARRGSPFGSSVAAHIVERIAVITGSLHRASDATGAPRVHGQLSKHAVLVDRAGALLVIGPGFPLLDALIVPAPENEADRWRYVAPETARAEAPDGRADIYSLAVLYYELLAGEVYRPGLGANEIYIRAVEGRPPDLPGRLPDPRPQLLEILSAALDPHRDRRFSVMESFGAAVRGEAAPEETTRKLLGKLIDEFVGAEAPRGASCLIARDLPAVRERAPIGAPRTPHVIARSISRLSEPEPERDDWAEVLGEEATQLEGAKPIAVEAPKPAELKLAAPAPLPEPVANPIAALSAELQMERTKPIGKKTVTILRLAAVAVVILVCGGMYLSMKSSIDTPEGERTGLGGRMKRAAERASGKKPAPIVPVQKPAPEPAEPTEATETAEPVVSAAPDAAEVARPAGLISIMSSPSGATVEIDGGYVGTTPLILKHNFNKNSYSVTISLKGHKPYANVVNVDPVKGTLSVMATLEVER